MEILMLRSISLLPTRVIVSWKEISAGADEVPMDSGLPIWAARAASLNAPRGPGLPRGRVAEKACVNSGHCAMRTSALLG